MMMGMVLLARGALRDGEAFVRAAALECLAAAILPVNDCKTPGVVGAIHQDGAVDSRSSPPSAGVPPLLTPCSGEAGEEEGLTARGLGDAVGAALADSEARTLQ